VKFGAPPKRLRVFPVGVAANPHLTTRVGFGGAPETSPSPRRTSTDGVEAAVVTVASALQDDVMAGLAGRGPS